MSRIYQGGQSENSYQASDRRTGYSPAQAISNQQAIIQEGESQMRNLKTKDREAQRKDQTADLERKSQDSADVSTLKMEQMQANNLLRQQQLVEKADAETAQLLAQSKLKMGQTTEKGQTSIQQTNDRGVLKLNHAREASALRLEQLEAKNLLASQHGATRADQSLASQHLQLSQQVERSNTSVMHSAISGLLDFGMEYAGKAIEHAAQEKEKDGYEDIFGEPPISPSGTVAAPVAAEAAISNVEVAEEQAIQKVAPGDTIGQEALRQPGADQSMQRSQSQAYVAGSALDLSSRLSDLVASNPTVLNGQGQEVPLNSLRTGGEYATAMKQLVRGLYKADGISKGDAYAAYMTYGKAARSAYNAQVQNAVPGINARNKEERRNAGLAAGTAIHMAGNAQAGWDKSITQAQASGHHDNSTTLLEINDATLKDHMSRLPKERIKDLLTVRKNGSQAGTEFQNSPRYRKMILDEYESRSSAENQYFTTQEKANGIEVKQITQDVRMAVMAPGLDGDQTRAIRQEAIERLEEIATPQARDAAQVLREKKGNNPSVFLGLVEAMESNDPPSDEEIAEYVADTSITYEEGQKILEMGMRSNQITQAVTKAGLQPVKDQVKDAVVARLGALNIPSEDRALLSDQLTAYLVPQATARLNSFINQDPPPNSLQIQQEAAKIMTDLGKEVYDPSSSDNRTPLLSKANGPGESRFYSLNIDTRQVNASVNKATGKYNREFIRTKPSDIPSYASINDAYLNRDDFLKGVELWDKGRPATEYPLRVQQVAKRLGVSPTALIRSQSQALGYGNIDKVSPALTANPPTDMKTGFNALQSMGFPTRGAAYLAGNIMQESSWDGQQKPWGEVANDGSDRNGGLVSWMDGVAHNNFRLTKIENYLGKDIASASPSEQLQAMQWEMKKDYTWAYRIFMNPNSTNVQLERASKGYWGYGHEGDRFTNAESLLR